MLTASSTLDVSGTLDAYVERSGMIEELARSDPREASRLLQSLRDDVARYSRNVARPRSDLAARATAFAAVVDRLLEDLASGRVRSITGLRRQLIQFQNASQATREA